MVKKSEKDQVSLTQEDLLKQNDLLIKELKNQQILQDAIWILITDVSRRLQVSSASVKAAETSLLDHDIFWDAATQHEFLKTIDVSVDEVSRFAMLISFASRLIIGKVELRQEIQILQEILTVVQDDFISKYNSNSLTVELPENGNEVFVDFEYLSIAIRMLIDVLTDNGSKVCNIRLFAYKDQGANIVEIDEVDGDLYNLMSEFPKNLDQNFIKDGNLSSDKVLMSYIAHQLCSLQNIKLTACEDQEDRKILRLVIPPVF